MEGKCNHSARPDRVMSNITTVWPLTDGHLSCSRCQDPLVAPLPEEALHPLHPGRRRPALPVPLEFVHIFPEHVSSPQSRDQVIKFSLVLMSVKDKGMFYMWWWACRLDNYPWWPLWSGWPLVKRLALLFLRSRVRILICNKKCQTWSSHDTWKWSELKESLV